jgi:hypothetical protein
MNSTEKTSIQCDVSIAAERITINPGMITAQWKFGTGAG